MKTKIITLSAAFVCLFLSFSACNTEEETIAPSTLQLDGDIQDTLDNGDYIEERAND